MERFSFFILGFSFLINIGLLEAQTLAPENTLFKVRTTAPAQVTVERNGFSATAHTTGNFIATLKLDHPVFDMSSSQVQVGSVYPNPSSVGRVSVEFSVPQPQTVGIAVFDVLGKSAVTNMKRSLTAAGVYRLDLNLENYFSGIYFLRLNFPRKNFIRKFTLLGKGAAGASALTFLGQFDFNPTENRYRPPLDVSGLDTARVGIHPDDAGKYVPLDTVVVYTQPASVQDTVRLFLPLKKMDVITYLLRAFLKNGPVRADKAFNGYIELLDGTQLPIHGKYDGNIVNAQHTGVDAKNNQYARVIIAPADSIQGIDANVSGLPAGLEKDLGSFGINWKDFPPEFLATFIDTVNAGNGFANMYRDSTAKDFNEDIDSMLVTNLPSEQIQQTYNKETGELSVNLNGYDQNFDATLRVADKAGNTISTPVHFNVTPDTAHYKFTAELTNGPNASKQYHGMMVFSSGDTASFTGEFNKPIIVARYNKNMPSVEDYIIRSIFATDSTEAAQDTLRMIANADTVDLGTIIDQWKNFPPQFTAGMKDIYGQEDSPVSIKAEAEDFNKDSISYDVLNLPAGWSYTIKADSIDLMPPENWYGTIGNIIITASDGKATTRNNPFSITLSPVNDAPATSVPDQTVPRNGQIVIDLNQYVNDVDNLLSEMSWKAADYDTNLVKILIDTLNQATIKSRGENGSTPILWTATDPDSAAGRNEANILIDPAYLLTVRLQDPVDDTLWGNAPFDLILYKDGKPDTTRLITNEMGEASAYTLSKSGRVIVPLSDSLYETTQRFNGLKDDARLVVPVIHRDYPLKEFVKIQGGSWYQGFSGAFVTSWDPAFFNRGTEGKPDTLRMIYYDNSESNNGIAALRDSIMSWNDKYFRRMTPNWVLEPPKIGRNVEFYHPQSQQDEIDKTLEMWAADTLGNNAGIGWIISHYKLNPGGGTNGVSNNPSGPFYATRGRIITRKPLRPTGTEFEEAGTTLQTNSGEVQEGAFGYTIYGGGVYWPPFTGKGSYKGKEYVLEVLIGKLKYNVEPGTEVRPTRIVPPVKGLGK